MTSLAQHLFPDEFQRETPAAPRSLLLDAAMGTGLRAAGWPSDRPTLCANLEAPGLVEAVHRAHAQAGARILCSNTFAALEHPGRDPSPAVAAAVRLARGVAQLSSQRTLVAGCLAAYGLAGNIAAAKTVLRTLTTAGIDLLVFETCNSPQDAQAGLELHRWLEGELEEELNPALPLVVCASSTDGSPGDAERVRQVVETVRRATPARAPIEAGLNCCRGPEDVLALAAKLPHLAWLKPSAGVPPHSVDNSAMAEFARRASAAGVPFVGACCGGTEQTLRTMAPSLSGSC